MTGLIGGRRSILAGAEPLSPRRKWRAILLATLLLIPAYWALVAGLVSIASEDRRGAPDAGLSIALGLILVPFVFIALAFLSEHPRAPAAAAKAMVLSLAVGIPVSALAYDAVTGFVAGIGAGGIAAMRADLDRSWKARALAILIVTVWAYVTVRVMPEAALLLAPVLPFTSVGVADHLLEIRRERRAAPHPPTDRG
ncbi:MAG: hypothetical protein ABWY83_06410 [Actinomycetota bacterium]